MAAYLSNYDTGTSARPIGTIYVDDSTGTTFIVYDQQTYYTASSASTWSEGDACEAVKKIEEERVKEESPLEIERPYDHRPVDELKRMPFAPVARRGLNMNRGRATFK